MTVTSSRTTPATSTPEGAPRRRPRRPVRWSRGATYTALVVGLLLTLMPFIWMALGSFKTQGELLQRPITWWPQNPTLDNYERWLSQLNYGQYFTNSIVVAVAVVLGNIVFCSMVGYALAKMSFPGKRVLFALVMLTLMVPGVVTLVPMFVLVSNMGLVNTYPALILPFL
ncbi:MAG: sugar transporter permease, partial [Cellulosimicrobium sp.]|nr:sugar transporter permease [Cellulosimicrobium sp.]